ncbi:uncharacterized protein LOC110822929 [Carica papaya]|uniref:uncharacterized protein LOC110822929 n=1 Tax=Carica papaya TaxID=3649 RepID=UPI000B8C9850|nr:uncharacterized protein LOC110822929 [Carica papaya]
MASASSNMLALILLTWMLGCCHALISYEQCIKNIPAPVTARPPSEKAETAEEINWLSIICRDLGRSLYFYIRMNNKLPDEYVKAVCHVFKNEEAEIKTYITQVFKFYDYKQLMAGRSCALYS